MSLTKCDDITMKARVLVVDDDPALAEMLTIVLRGEGFDTAVVAEGNRALPALRELRPDLVLLDLMLPGINGIDVCKAIRAESGVPIVMLTAKSDTVDIVLGLESGADDYVAKPFQLEEVLARLRALIRRSTGRPQPVFQSGAVTLDPRTARVTLGGAPVKLTSHEFRVLSYLMHHADRVVSQGELTEHIYAQDFDRDSNTVEVFVARLRRKLGA